MQPMDATRDMPSAQEGSLVSGRYRVERFLASGRTGAVFQVSDQVTGRQLALKRLRADADSHVTALFQHEFYTLASLRHPNAVQAYDYGIDADGHYYTMALLEGHDLRTSAPLAWPTVCGMLREIAQVLGALHALRLLHRDVNPQNLWLSPDGSLKLIDFGALCPFGVAEDIAGAAPVVPPEALYAQPLDERSDLYGIGALGYWLLTGAYPYRAHHISDLPRSWQRPLTSVAAAVAALERTDLPAVPPKLEALITSLLSHNPLGRPASTAALIDRLEAIGEFGSLAHEVVPSRSLPRSGFVGRAWARKQLKDALGHGDERGRACMLLVSAAGMGRTRLLRELALSARLEGAHVLEAHATEHAGSHRVTEALALALLDALPEQAAQAAKPHAPLLAHVSPRLHSRLSSSLGSAVQPAQLGDVADSRIKIQAALRAWFLAVAREHTLVVLVDDLHCADEPSAAFLAGLAEASGQHKLLLGATLLDESQHINAAVEHFRKHANVSRLEPLSVTELHEVLRSIFGAAPHLPLLSARLHDVAHGCPAYALELAQHLVRSATIYYARGGWHIPSNVTVAALPATRYDCMLKRLEHLPSSARALGQVLSIQPGSFSIETCTALFEKVDKSAFDDLEALVREAVLSNTPRGFKFAHPHLRAHLLAELEEPRRSAVHARLGAWMLRDAQATCIDRLHAGVHLMRAGDERGAEIIAKAALGLRGADSLGDTAPVLHEAIELFKQAGHKRHELVTLLGRVVLASFYGDFRFSDRYGDEMLELFVDVVGLRTARRLRPWIGRKLSLTCGMTLAALRFAWQRKNPLVPSFRAALLLLFGATAGLAALRAVRVDPEATARCANVLEPFTVLGPEHPASVAHEFCAALTQTNRDRSSVIRTRWQHMLETLRSENVRRALGDDSHRRYLAGSLYAFGAHEALRDDSNALWYAEQLEALDDAAFAMQADKIRMTYHGYRGEPALCEHYRKRNEAEAIARGSAWQVETWGACAAIPLHERVDDALAMKRTLDELGRLHQTLPSFRNFEERARGASLLLQGDASGAAHVLARVSHDQEPLALIGWTHAQGVLARAYNHLGDHARARAVCLRALSRLSPDDLECTALNLGVEVQLALADAALGDCESAVRRLDALIAHHGPNQNPLTLGALHEARARVALTQDDAMSFEDHVRQARAWYLPTAIPTLVQRCDRVTRERRTSVRPEREAPLARHDARDHEADVPEISTERVRADAALSVLAASADSDEAYLFATDAQGPSLTAKTGDEAVPPELAWWVKECLRARASPPSAPTERASSTDTLALKSKSYRLVRLYTPWPTGHHVLGAAVFVTHNGGALGSPDERALSELEAQLWKAREHQQEHQHSAAH